MHPLLARFRPTPIAGGDINEAWRGTLPDGTRVFLKSHASPPPGMFAAEARGLDWLRAGPLRVPRVIEVHEELLVLEWLELGARTRASDEAFGRGLAGLHRVGAPRFGFDGASPEPATQAPTDAERQARRSRGRGCPREGDNYLATLPQDNTPEDDVVAFWIERRLRPLVARLAGAADLHRALDRLAARRDRFGPPEPPARLHGDLWWGNVATCAGVPVIFDPAVYGGPREVDLAMLALFGELPARIVDAYDEVWPLADGWRERVPLWQLYPLAAHAVLFGGGYHAQLARSLDALVTRGRGESW